MQTKIKFKDVPIGCKFKDKNNNILFKVDSDFFYNLKSTMLKRTMLISKYSLDKDEELELITKCANCKNYNGNYYCEEINKDFREHGDPETFSCSLFEMKTE